MAGANDSSPPSEPKPVLRARWSEDWSALRNLTPLLDTSVPTSHRLLRPIKNIPLGESDDFYLSLGGAWRLAYEKYAEADTGISEIGDQDALMNRFTMHADLNLNRSFRLFTELEYAKVDHRDGGAKATDETNLNFQQLFFDSRIDAGDQGRGVLRLGRQFIETGNLFITAGEANNVRLVYNGGRVAWIKDDFVPFEAFAAEYVDYADGPFEMSGTDEYFWGLRMGQRLAHGSLWPW